MILVGLLVLLLAGSAQVEFEVRETLLPADCLFGFEESSERPDACAKAYFEMLRSREMTGGRPSVRRGDSYRTAIVEGRSYEVVSSYTAGRVDWSVVLGDDVVCELSEPMRGGEEYFAFYGHNDQWIFETWDHVLVNGTDIAARDGVDAVYYYTLLDEKPFYLFDDEGRTRVMAGGRVLPQTYDRVLHHLCCEYGAMNPHQQGNKVAFIGIRGSQAYFVEVTAKSHN
jgi:hypothetical protein